MKNLILALVNLLIIACGSTMVCATITIDFENEALQTYCDPPRLVANVGSNHVTFGGSACLRVSYLDFLDSNVLGGYYGFGIALSGLANSVSLDLISNHPIALLDNCYAEIGVSRGPFGSGRRTKTMQILQRNVPTRISFEGELFDHIHVRSCINTQFGYMGSAWIDNIVLDHLIPPQPPVPVMTYAPRPDLSGFEIYFDASASFDPDGELSWGRTQFDFGDGTPVVFGRGPVGVWGGEHTWSHFYQNLGTYKVKLTVADIDGLTSSLEQEIDVHATESGACCVRYGECVESTTYVECGRAGGNPPSPFNMFYGDGSTCAGSKCLAPPIAFFRYTPHVSPRVFEPITFNASRSIDINNGALVYLWDFGDGSISEGESVTHIYSKAGTYNVSLQATNAQGFTGSFSQDISVGGAPGACCSGSFCFENKTQQDCEYYFKGTYQGVGTRCVDINCACIDNDHDGYGSPGNASCPHGSQSDCNNNDPAVYPGAPELCDGKDNDCDGVIPTNEQDDDHDTVLNCVDNCPNDCNPNQEDTDQDGKGDACGCDHQRSDISRYEIPIPEFGLTCGKEIWKQEANSGEKLDIIWRCSSHGNYYDFGYTYPPGCNGETRREQIGACYFNQGLNVAFYYAPRFNAWWPWDKPDFFTRTLWVNIDGYTDDPGFKFKDGFLDVFAHSSDVCTHKYSRSHYWYNYKDGCNPISEKDTYTKIKPGCEKWWLWSQGLGSPELIDPPFGTETRALFDELLLELEQFPHQTESVMGRLIFPPCDINLDGDCDEQDIAASQGLIDKCYSDYDFNPLIDLDGDGCFTINDNRLLFPKEDVDGDGRVDGQDNCPTVVNPDQADMNLNGIGDACDPDDDGDGSLDTNDCAPINASIHPGATEICDGKDNNCDGKIDEGFDLGAACTVGIGACQRSGVKVCAADGLGTVCNAVPGQPTGNDDTCNGIDDNCNGQTDEGYVPTPTSCGQGVCASTGQMVCNNGVIQNTCTPGTSTTENCDGLDNDCNGLIDDGLGSTTCGLGQCAHTIENCKDGHPQTCNEFEGATTEICGDGIDNDCDGQIDEGCNVIGDLNNDRCVDLADYNIFMAALKKGAPFNMAYDLNKDGSVNIADARFLATKFTNPKGVSCK